MAEVERSATFRTHSLLRNVNHVSPQEADDTTETRSHGLTGDHVIVVLHKDSALNDFQRRFECRIRWVHLKVAVAPISMSATRDARVTMLKARALSRQNGMPESAIVLAVRHGRLHLELD